MYDMQPLSRASHPILSRHSIGTRMNVSLFVKLFMIMTGYHLCVIVIVNIVIIIVIVIIPACEREIAGRNQTAASRTSTTTGSGSGYGYAVSGEKAFVVNASIADCFVVCAATPGHTGESLFLVPKSDTSTTRVEGMATTGMLSAGAATVVFRCDQRIFECAPRLASGALTRRIHHIHTSEVHIYIVPILYNVQTELPIDC